ncbi:hypothetical protein [Pararhodobacter oceanensis]|uniref:hypothetical protein n=1 Tax=Pararhodobacter oceanensis TaxID=2172121 RepID=UPI003A953EFF
MKILHLPLLMLLAACATGQPLRAPAPQDRIAAECALLAQAAAQMEAAGQPAHDGLTEGCPGTTATDSRPLSQQSAATRAAVAAALPAGVEAGSRAELLFRRMITRGVPLSVASALTSSEAFAAASR